MFVAKLLILLSLGQFDTDYKNFAFKWRTPPPKGVDYYETASLKKYKLNLTKKAFAFRTCEIYSCVYFEWDVKPDTEVIIRFNSYTAVNTWNDLRICCQVSNQNNGSLEWNKLFDFKLTPAKKFIGKWTYHYFKVKIPKNCEHLRIDFNEARAWDDGEHQFLYIIDDFTVNYWGTGVP